MTRFNTQHDLDVEIKAIETYTKVKGGRYKKLGEHDIDFVLYNEDNEISGYVEVKGRNRTMREAFPLPVALFKLSKLENKHNNGIIIWSCYDGMYYANINDIKGEVLFGGREPRPGAEHDKQLMVYYEKQEALKYIRY